MDAAATSGGDGDVSGDVGEGERGNQRESECVWELGEGERGFVPGRQVDEGSGWAAGSGQLRGKHAVLALEHLPACAGESKQLAGTAGGLGC